MKVCRAAAAAAIAFMVSVAAAQTASVSSPSLGRGAPVRNPLPHPGDGSTNMAKYLAEYPIVGPFKLKPSTPSGATTDVGSAWNGAAPKGVTPLPVDEIDDLPLPFGQFWHIPYECTVYLLKPVSISP
jgi:hypothetical protein